MARKRKATVRREPSGKVQRSHVSPEKAVRALAIGNRIKHVGVTEADAGDALAGFTLGVLWQRGRASANPKTGEPSDPTGITEAQFRAGESFAQVCRDHAYCQGYEVKGVRSAPLMFVERGSSVFDPEESTVLRARAKFVRCYDELGKAAKLRGFGVMTVTYAVCVEHLPLAALSEYSHVLLHAGLDALALALGIVSVDKQARR